MAAKNLYITQDIMAQLRACSKLDMKPPKRYRTGVPIIDHIFTSLGTSGLVPGNYLLVGDPGCGKSSMALQLMGEMKLKGHICIYLAYEGKDQIKGVLLRMRMMPSKFPALMDESDGVPATSDAIVALLERVNAANKTGLPIVLCIDSVKNVNAADGGTKGRRIAIQALNEAARENNCIVFLVAHVSKETQGKKNKKIEGPTELLQLSDVRIDFIDQTPKEEIGKNFYRKFSLDTSSKNRFGRPGIFDDFMLTEKGFVFPLPTEEK